MSPEINFLSREETYQDAEASLRDLLSEDGKLFNLPVGESASGQARKLHEVCINHKLAEKLARHILSNERYSGLYVDIEFNKEGASEKLVLIRRRKAQVRPDIIIHNRLSGSQKINLLVVECKIKGASAKTLSRDRTKIRALMRDSKFEYQFGLQVVYGNSGVSGTFFYHVPSGILAREISCIHTEV